VCQRDGEVTSSQITSAITNVIQRNYLAKWTVVGILIGTIAGVGATVFYVMIQVATNGRLGGPFSLNNCRARIGATVERRTART